MKSKNICVLNIIVWMRVFFMICLDFATLANAQSSDYPNRPITLITPFPAAGSTDLIARTIAQKLQEVLGKPIIVENHAGAGGNIGSNIVAKAAPDGYTILITSSSTHSIGAVLNKSVPFNYDTDFTPIVFGAVAPQIFMVTKTIPATTLKDFIGFAKANPTVLNFSSAGNGTIMHLTGEAFKVEAGVQMVHIPYKGSGLSIPDLISGKVHVCLTASSQAYRMCKTGSWWLWLCWVKTVHPCYPTHRRCERLAHPTV